MSTKDNFNKTYQAVKENYSTSIKIDILVDSSRERRKAEAPITLAKEQSMKGSGKMT